MQLFDLAEAVTGARRLSCGALNMEHYLLHTALLLIGAFLLGAFVGFILKRMFGGGAVETAVHESTSTAQAAAAGAVAATTGAVAAAATQVGDTVGSATETVVEPSSETLASVTETVRDAGAQATDAVATTVDTASEAVSDVADTVSETVSDAADGMVAGAAATAGAAAAAVGLQSSEEVEQPSEPSPAAVAPADDPLPVAATSSGAGVASVASRVADPVDDGVVAAGAAAAALGAGAAALASGAADAAATAVVCGDDLTRIAGIDEALAGRLADLDVTSYSEIADWRRADITRVEGGLGVSGVVSRGNWIEQAAILSKGDETLYARRYHGAAIPVVPSPEAAPSAASSAPAAEPQPEVVSEAVETAPDEASDMVSTAAAAAAAAAGVAASAVAVMDDTSETEAAETGRETVAETLEEARDAASELHSDGTTEPQAEQSADVQPDVAAETDAGNEAMAGGAVAGGLAAAATAIGGDDAVPGDDLTYISGIDQDIADGLTGKGVTSFAQIANWGPSDVTGYNEAFGFTGRIERENWVEQAQILARGEETAYARSRRAIATGSGGAAAAVSSASAAGSDTVRGDTDGMVSVPSDPAPADTGDNAASEETSGAETGVVMTAAAAASAALASTLPADRAGGVEVSDDADMPDASSTGSDEAPTGGETLAAAAVAAAATTAFPSQDNDAAATRGRWQQSSSAGRTESREDNFLRSRRGSSQPLRSVRSEALVGDNDRGGAPSGEPDDLKRIRGVGVVIERKLNAMGITQYAQIAGWSSDDVARVSDVLAFKGRIERENWIDQAKILGGGGETEFARRFDRGEIDPDRT